MSFSNSKRSLEDTFYLEADLESFNATSHLEAGQSRELQYDSSDINPDTFSNGIDLHSNISKSYNNHYMNGAVLPISHNTVFTDRQQAQLNDLREVPQTYTSTGFDNSETTLDRLNLNPAKYNLHSLSPTSPSVASHLSPATAVGTGYNSDQAHSEISEYTTPSFDEEPLNVDFGMVSSLDEDQVPAQEFSNIAIAAQVENTEAQHSLSLPKDGIAAQKDTTSMSYLMSPVNSTIESSPMNERNHSNYSMQSTVPSNVTSAPHNRSPNLSIATATMQQTPALTGSSKSSSQDGLNTNMRHLGSPIVMVENYSRGELPSQEQLSRSFSRRSRGSQMSATHLSPTINRGEYIEEDYSDQDMIGRSGIDPASRSQVNSGEIPTLQEQEEQRHIAEKNVEISQWLSTSENGSEESNPPSPKALGSTLLVRPGDRRRAKSVGDPRFMTNVYLPDDSGIPGPGILLDEDSGSDDGDEDEDDAAEDYPISPPANVDANYDENEDPFPTINEEPHPSQFRHAIRPWADPKIDTYEARNRPEQIQPPTANAAMMWYNRRAGDIETSSRVATWGTRRLSETDVDKFIKDGGILKRLSFQKDKAKAKPERRTSGFLNNLLQRAPSNKRRHSDKNAHNHLPPASPERKRKDSGSNLLTPSRTSSFPSRRSPMNNTIGVVAAMSGQMAAIASNSVSTTNTVATTGPWERGIQLMKRSRSKSDLVRSASPEGLKGLWSKAGGPPVANLATGPTEPPPVQDQRSPFILPEPLDEDDENENEDEVMGPGTKMLLSIDTSEKTTEQIIPTLQGFLTHTQQLNPRLQAFLADRISHEQVGRYKRLSKLKIAHLNSVRTGQCLSTSKFCPDLGGKATIMDQKVAHSSFEPPGVGSQIVHTGISDEEDDSSGEATTAQASFPDGVPLPPTKRLPAEFECTICFTVKKFKKPSDWTKHVHEDVQPFTCTWPQCAEAKSFKRKADWVRHENEKHRKLEWWTCNISECTHTCYRKDNFVQHLIREHKYPEPKAKSAKTPSKASGRKGKSGQDIEANDAIQSDSDQIWQLVETCQHETKRKPQEEPCKFCGNVCSSWKKLTVHLARHMEQISLPILSLVNVRHVTVDTIISPHNQPPPQNHSLSPMTPAVAKVESFQSSPYASSHGNLSYTSLNQIPQHMPMQDLSRSNQSANPPAQPHYSSVSPLPSTYDYSQIQTTQPLNNYIDPTRSYSPSGFDTYQQSSTAGFVPVNAVAGSYNNMMGDRAYAAPLGTHVAVPNVSVYSSSSIPAGTYQQSNSYPVTSGGPEYAYNTSTAPGQHGNYPLVTPELILYPQGPEDPAAGFQAPNEHSYI